MTSSLPTRFPKLSLFATLLLWSSNPASAQTADANPTETTKPAPVEPEPSVLSHEVAARLEAVEQLTRTLAKAQAPSAEPTKPIEENKTVTVDDKGVTLSGSDGYQLRLRALMQIDGRFFLDDDVLQDKDTLLIRKMRPTVEGTLFGLVDYRLTPEFAGGAVQVMEAYVDVHPRPWVRLRIGKMKGPIGLERLQSDADLPFVERALDQNLSTVRDLGVQLWGDVGGGILNYVVGIYNGGTDGSNGDLDTNQAKDFQGRLLVQPFKTESLQYLGNLGVGIAASTGKRKGLPVIGTAAAVPGLPSFKSSGQNTFFSYLAPVPDATGTGTVFAHLRQSRLNPQLYYYLGCVGLQGEYLLSRQTVQKGEYQATLTHKAAHVSASVAILGTEGYDGVTPTIPFTLGGDGWGALELAVRWSWLKLDPSTFADPAVSDSVAYADPLKSARSAQSWAGAINYVPRRSFRLAVDFERATFDGGAAAADKETEVDRKTETVIISRAQINF
jgi:phosphate-selective porin OprO and OprP